MRLEIPTPHGSGVAELDRPRGAARGLLVITHRANGNPDTYDVLAVRSVLLKLGVAVARVLQPYRFAGRKTPPQPPVQDEAWLAMITAIRTRRGFATIPLFVGGRSNGARVAARTAPDAGAAGVIALAFPVHPPGRPEVSRLAELDAATVPTLVIQGERDPFGVPPKKRGRQLVVIPSDGHSLRRDPAAIAAAAVRFVTTQLERARVGE